MASFKVSHLEPDECEYELCIRGLPSQLTRTRLANLVDILSREALGTLVAPEKCCNQDFVDEVNQCFRKLEELEKLLVTLADHSQSDFKPHEKLHSRLNHLFIRLGRIHSSDSRIRTQVNGLSGKCDKYINFLYETLDGKASLSELLKGEKLIPTGPASVADGEDISEEDATLPMIGFENREVIYLFDKPEDYDIPSTPPPTWKFNSSIIEFLNYKEGNWKEKKKKIKINKSGGSSRK